PSVTHESLLCNWASAATRCVWTAISWPIAVSRALSLVSRALLREVSAATQAATAAPPVANAMTSWMMSAADTPVSVAMGYVSRLDLRRGDDHLIRRDIRAHLLPAHMSVDLVRCCSAMRSDRRR